MIKELIGEQYSLVYSYKLYCPRMNASFESKKPGIIHFVLFFANLVYTKRANMQQKQVDMQWQYGIKELIIVRSTILVA